MVKEKQKENTSKNALSLSLNFSQLQCGCNLQLKKYRIFFTLPILIDINRDVTIQSLLYHNFYKITNIHVLPIKKQNKSCLKNEVNLFYHLVFKSHTVSANIFM